jgi:hypothetical protein
VRSLISPISTSEAWNESITLARMLHSKTAFPNDISWKTGVGFQSNIKTSDNRKLIQCEFCLFQDYQELFIPCQHQKMMEYVDEYKKDPCKVKLPKSSDAKFFHSLNPNEPKCPFGLDPFTALTLCFLDKGVLWERPGYLLFEKFDRGVNSSVRLFCTWNVELEYLLIFKGFKRKKIRRKTERTSNKSKSGKRLKPRKPSFKRKSEAIKSEPAIQPSKKTKTSSTPGPQSPFQSRATKDVVNDVEKERQQEILSKLTGRIGNERLEEHSAAANLLLEVFPTCTLSKSELEQLNQISTSKSIL